MIPLHIVTGFLGAGKTSFLNRLLRDPAAADTLVVVNEFGEAALDHWLYEKLDGEVALLASGCLCCALRGDFVEGLNGWLDKRARGEMRDFRRIVVETSGLADPGPILHAVLADAGLAARLRLANVTTLVDAVNGLATLARHGEARRQVALADRLLLTKTDLADPQELRRRLAELAPLAAIGEAASLSVQDFLAETARPPVAYSARAAHGGAEAHVLRAGAPIDGAAFARFLNLLGEAAGPRLLRVKGLIATSDAPDRPWLIQGAQHALASPLRLDAWPGGVRDNALVVIGEEIGATVERLWGALTGVVAPDAPDWSALADNPLSPRAPAGLFG